MPKTRIIATPVASRTLRHLVRQEIARSGKSQMVIGQLAGISQPYLSELMSGAKKGLSLDVADRILSALGKRLVFTIENIETK